MAAIVEVNYFNSFWLKRVKDLDADVNATVPGIVIPVIPGANVWPGIIDTPAFPYHAQHTDAEVAMFDWFVEESRIRGGYNNTSTDYGVRAYLEEEYPLAAVRFNSMIYSGIYNARTGINNTNQFPVGEDIIRSVDPINGSIQKIYAEDTNLIIFQESKVSRALIDKDAIYSAEGGGTVTSTNVVIGQIVPYAGEYGISKNPESFAIYGFRKYFTDKNKSAVLRLSNDGITELSRYGMTDYFRDQFETIDNGGDTGELVGGWDNYTKQYTLSIKPWDQDGVKGFATLAFDESVLGWPTFYSYNPTFIWSINGNFYSIPDYNATSTATTPGGNIYKHYAEVTGANRNNYYGNSYSSSITFVLNPQPSIQKVFKTLNYEGSNGWQVDTIISDATGRDLYTTTWTDTQDTAAQIRSYLEGEYQEDNITYHAGFYRKENKYVANLINSSANTQGEVIYGTDMSGIKGYVTTIKMSIDSTTNPGGVKELFSASSEFVVSSY